TVLEASTLAGLSAAQRGALEARLPGGRLIRPEEIAEVVWWLTGRDAVVLHGAVIDASMGLGVHPGLLSGRDAAGAAGHARRDDGQDQADDGQDQAVGPPGRGVA